MRKMCEINIWDDESGDPEITGIVGEGETLLEALERAVEKMKAAIEEAPKYQ